MTEDHIKTVVIDPPLERLANDSQDDPRVDKPETQNDEPSQPSPPLRSWLT